MKKSGVVTCLNCEKNLQQGFVYCSYCGQKTTVHRLNFHSIAHDFLHYFTHVERNIFSLVRRLSFQPGVVVKEYLNGKRKKYFPPVNFFLIVAGLLVLSVSLFHTFDVAFFVGTGRQFAHHDSPLLHVLNSKINWLLLFTTPLIALLYRCFYFRKANNFFEHLVMSLYSMGYMLLLFALVAAPAFSLTNTLAGFETMLWLFIAALCFYYSMAYYQLYPARGFVSFVLTLLTSIAVFAILLLFMLLCLRFYYKLTNGN